MLPVQAVDAARFVAACPAERCTGWPAAVLAVVPPDASATAKEQSRTGGSEHRRNREKLGMMWTSLRLKVFPMPEDDSGMRSQNKENATSCQQFLGKTPCFE